MRRPSRTRRGVVRCRGWAAAALGAVLAVTGAAPVGEAQSGISVRVDAAADRLPIDPRIYGVNFADAAELAALNAPVNRAGGNSTTRHNWYENATNRGSDWYFESIPDGPAVPGQESDAFVQATRDGGAEPMMTIPMIGWVARVSSARDYLWSFSASQYGDQQDCDWQWRPDACNGVYLDGSYVTGNDPHDANTPSDPAFQRRWVEHLVDTWGPATGGGVRYYILDNEPTLWHSTHRDVHPDPQTMIELRDAMIAYGSAIREVEPDAVLVGPEVWGWMGYFWSGYDQWYKGETGCWSCEPDRDANGGLALLPWILSELHAHEQTTGVRVLDLFTAHIYPQSGEFGGGTDSGTQGLRNRSTRSLWDPSYVDESWIGEPVALIPRLRDWVDSHSPGLDIGITEYSWGADDHINGATAQADILGIFGREGLDLATRWVVPDTGTPVFKAFQMYRNYDGGHSTFGDVSVRATVPDPDELAVFAAERTSDGALTVMAINKVTTSALVDLGLAGFEAGPAAEVWQLTAADTLQRLADASVGGGSLSTTLPAQSITLFVIPASRAPLPSLSVGDASIIEGDSGTKTLTFTVSLSAASDSPVEVGFSTRDGSANPED